MTSGDSSFLGGIHDLAAFEREFGLARGYIDDLICEDDWSLVIKAHTLLESTASLALALHLGKPELKSVFANVPMSNRQHGKFAFLKAMGLMSENELKFVVALSALRNAAAHNAVHLGFSLRGYFDELPAGKRRSLIRTLNLRLASIAVGTEKYEDDEAVLYAPKHAIWASLTQCLGTLYFLCIFGKKRMDFVASKLEEHKTQHGPIRLTPEIDDL